MLFLKDKQTAIITLLKKEGSEWHLSKLAKESNSTFFYVTKLISILEKKALVTTELKRKRRIVKLTEKGLKLASLLEEAKNIISS